MRKILTSRRKTSSYIIIGIIVIGAIVGTGLTFAFLWHDADLSVPVNNIDGGRCKFCGEEIPGIWE